MRIANPLPIARVLAAMGLPASEASLRKALARETRARRGSGTVCLA